MNESVMAFTFYEKEKKYYRFWDLDGGSGLAGSGIESGIWIDIRYLETYAI